MWRTMGMLVPSLSFRFGIGVWMLAIVADVGERVGRLFVDRIRSDVEFYVQLLEEGKSGKAMSAV